MQHVRVSGARAHQKISSLQSDGVVVAPHANPPWHQLKRIYNTTLLINQQHIVHISSTATVKIPSNMKLHFLLAAVAALLCAAPIVAASECRCFDPALVTMPNNNMFCCPLHHTLPSRQDNAIAFEGAKSVNSVLVDVSKETKRPGPGHRPTGGRRANQNRGENGPVPSRPRRTPQPTRRARRTPRPTRRPPSGERRDARARRRIVRRSDFRSDECDGNRRNLSHKCSELNRLVCSLHRRKLESRERRLCNRVGLDIGTGRRRSRRPRSDEEEYDEEEYDSMDSEDEEDYDSMDSEDKEEDVFMEEE
eukprot:scaffold5499_cov137-Skeletonema_dohrnii-CCMP3373.AAC.9